MKEAISLAVSGYALPPEIMERAMHAMMKGEAEPAQVGALLSALSMKGETASEISTAVKVLRELMLPFVLPDNDKWVDVVGTGGDGAGLFNISTGSALIACTGGVKIAKHGNVGVSSSSGSADLLREAGIKIDIDPERLRQIMSETQFGFLFAPIYHSAMKNVAPIRKSLGIRTIFNILGPLANPARVKNQVLGVYQERLLKPYAEVCRDLGSERSIIVHSTDGLDELSVVAPSKIAELHEQRIQEYEINPKELGMNYDSLEPLKVNHSAESLALLLKVFKNENPPKIAVDALALNAGLLFYLSKNISLKDGITLAKELIFSGLVWDKLQQIIAKNQE